MVSDFGMMFTTFNQFWWISARAGTANRLLSRPTKSFGSSNFGIILKFAFEVKNTVRHILAESEEAHGDRAPGAKSERPDHLYDDYTKARPESRNAGT